MDLLVDLLVFCCERLSWVLEKNRQNSDHCTKTAVLINSFGALSIGSGVVVVAVYHLV